MRKKKTREREYIFFFFPVFFVDVIHFLRWSCCLGDQLYLVANSWAHNSCITGLTIGFDCIQLLGFYNIEEKKIKKKIPGYSRQYQSGLVYNLCVLLIYNT